MIETATVKQLNDIAAKELSKDKRRSKGLELRNAHIKQQVGMDYDSYIEYKAMLVFGLLFYGDRFYKAIGLALNEGDYKQSCKIIRYFNHDMEKYAILAKMHIAKIRGEICG